ncbi:MAG: HsdR family type I site-specific deoxyribonuclease [Tenericutes bacterium]|nr:HsdR family type I site-specific deoxyribonuclease [Mycoplasmatota bacterium]
MFDDELKYEKELVKLLSEKYGWETKTLRYKTEEQLIQNWADILFMNNRSIDRLSDYPLTKGEMLQIIEQINLLKTPANINGFINGKTVSIIRDNQEDIEHFGSRISLKIYDRQEIAGGNSVYQIAEQPVFTAKSSILPPRRGDLMLLINGMPVIHIELKKSGIDISQACHQIEKYSHEGLFTGIFGLIQVFVAMTPEETIYFANPGSNGKFNKDYFFHWADFNNNPIDKWEEIAQYLLSIPMAHELIGYYTVADDTDGVLKVMRSYQYFAASKISDRIGKLKWGEKDIYGGYVWHTTGSGKTMTSFKSAQLIANSCFADKVLFLVDRIELGTQSLREYRAFSDERDDIQATEDTYALISKLKSNDPKNSLIVTSIQKMALTKEKASVLELEQINLKRIVFIVDEAHRSVFGDMLIAVKDTFPNAVFFGFTGTPILDENKKKMVTTAHIFGDELHRYSIADGIRDENVLGFDPVLVSTYKDRDVRKIIALEQAKAENETDAISEQKKAEVYYEFMDVKKTPMAGYKDSVGIYHKGIEDYLPDSQYETEEHQNMVVKDILDNYETLSHGGKFHAIFATSSIAEAIQYYKKFKKANPIFRVTALFDPNIDNSGKGILKEDALVEIIADYNKQYEQTFTLSSADKFKKDISIRLAHKKPYISIEMTPNQTISLLIVVDQMLTGYDSKWINTLYLDKKLKFENIVQAFSRTNRLFGPEKPHGIIRYYRRPHTMKKRIEIAFELYSGNKPFGIFVDDLKINLIKINEKYDNIFSIFKSAGVSNFEKLPDDIESCQKFSSEFNIFNRYLESAKVQGFQWKKPTYKFGKEEINLHLDETTFLILIIRYKELFTPNNPNVPDVPYQIEGYLMELNTGAIDSDYMNSRFKKYLKELQTHGESLDATLAELHKSFATLSQEDQKYAKFFLHDIQSGDIIVEEGKTFRDYVTEYRTKAKNNQIRRFASTIGIDDELLRAFMNGIVNPYNLNEFGRFDKLKSTVDKAKAQKYFEDKNGGTVPQRKVSMRIHELLSKFILEGGFEI